jgi:hypothetical protein
VSPSEDLLRRLAEEEAEEEVEDSVLDMRFGKEKQESHDIPPREDLRKREKARKRRSKYTTESRSRKQAKEE